jgi:hypothetical protein
MEPIAGISLLLQFKKISSGMLISAISQQQETYCCYKSQKRFPNGKREKTISHECEWDFGYHLFAAGDPWK